MRSKREIEDMMHEALRIKDDPNAYKCFGETYEDGVICALDWVLGNIDDPPVEYGER